MIQYLYKYGIIRVYIYMANLDTNMTTSSVIMGKYGQMMINMAYYIWVNVTKIK